MVSQSFDCQNSIKGRALTNIVCPPVDAQLIARYFAYFTGSSLVA